MDLGSVKDIDDLYSGFDDDNPALAADVVSFPLEPWNTLPWRVQRRESKAAGGVGGAV